jgi:hypothetical protein
MEYEGIKKVVKDGKCNISTVIEATSSISYLDSAYDTGEIMGIQSMLFRHV